MLIRAWTWQTCSMLGEHAECASLVDEALAIYELKGISSPARRLATLKRTLSTSATA